MTLDSGASWINKKVVGKMKRQKGRPSSADHVHLVNPSTGPRDGLGDTDAAIARINEGIQQGKAGVIEGNGGMAAAQLEGQGGFSVDLDVHEDATVAYSEAGHNPNDDTDPQEAFNFHGESWEEALDRSDVESTDLGDFVTFDEADRGDRTVDGDWSLGDRMLQKAQELRNGSEVPLSDYRRAIGLLGGKRDVNMPIEAYEAAADILVYTFVRDKRPTIYTKDAGGDDAVVNYTEEYFDTKMSRFLAERDKADLLWALAVIDLPLVSMCMDLMAYDLDLTVKAAAGLYQGQVFGGIKGEERMASARWLLSNLILQDDRGEGLVRSRLKQLVEDREDAAYEEVYGEFQGTVVLDKDPVRIEDVLIDHDKGYVEIQVHGLAKLFEMQMKILEGDLKNNSLTDIQGRFESFFDQREKRLTAHIDGFIEDLEAYTLERDAVLELMFDFLEHTEGLLEEGELNDNQRVFVHHVIRLIYGVVGPPEERLEYFLTGINNLILDAELNASDIERRFLEELDGFFDYFGQTASTVFYLQLLDAISEQGLEPLSGDESLGIDAILARRAVITSVLEEFLDIDPTSLGGEVLAEMDGLVQAPTGDKGWEWDLDGSGGESIEDGSENDKLAALEDGWNALEDGWRGIADDVRVDLSGTSLLDESIDLSTSRIPMPKNFAGELQLHLGDLDQATDIIVDRLQRDLERFAQMAESEETHIAWCREVLAMLLPNSLVSGSFAYKNLNRLVDVANVLRGHLGMELIKVNSPLHSFQDTVLASETHLSLDDSEDPVGAGDGNVDPIDLELDGWGPIAEEPAEEKDDANGGVEAFLARMASYGKPSVEEPTHKPLSFGLGQSDEEGSDVEDATPARDVLLLEESWDGSSEQQNIDDDFAREAEQFAAKFLEREEQERMEAEAQWAALAPDPSPLEPEPVEQEFEQPPMLTPADIKAMQAEAAGEVAEGQEDLGLPLLDIELVPYEHDDEEIPFIDISVEPITEEDARDQWTSPDTWQPGPESVPEPLPVAPAVTTVEARSVEVLDADQIFSRLANCNRHTNWEDVGADLVECYEKSIRPVEPKSAIVLNISAILDQYVDRSYVLAKDSVRFREMTSQVFVDLGRVQDERTGFVRGRALGWNKVPADRPPIIVEPEPETIVGTIWRKWKELKLW